ncbi:hypothetical protein [Streptomyces sp. Z26]|uniref:hypothetical protein n=1 Tax=Streptomyces sp. Z26 TaxID=2500177 RepID=UPI000EF133ED|nr:hypothetical protein [Streptomyces sp. Z26]RLL70305.1 hypothetical protein D7M15_08925 [Streptomyces sp. Z26]
MPKIDKDADVEIKLDSAAGLLQGSLTEEQRRGLFEHPGSAVVAVVEFVSVTYTGHADGEEKPPQVKVRVRTAEAARDDAQADQLREVARGFYRRRKMDQTLDELGPGPRDADRAVEAALASVPTEGEFREHKEQTAARKRRSGHVEQHG